MCSGRPSRCPASATGRPVEAGTAAADPDPSCTGHGSKADSEPAGRRCSRTTELSVHAARLDRGRLVDRSRSLGSQDTAFTVTVCWHATGLQSRSKVPTLDTAFVWFFSRRAILRASWRSCNPYSHRTCSHSITGCSPSPAAGRRRHSHASAAVRNQRVEIPDWRMKSASRTAR